MTFESTVVIAAATVSTLYAKTIIVLASIVMLVIRAPHAQRSRRLPVIASRGTRAEGIILAISAVAYFVPLLWIVTPLFNFAGYEMRAVTLYAGSFLMLIGMLLFHRSHVDLGGNFSHSLDIRTAHRLVTHGVYRYVRHPMYASLLIYLTGEALVIPNWIAGPAELIAMLLLFAVRVKAEESLLLEAFGAQYGSYLAATKRLVPHVW